MTSYEKLPRTKLAKHMHHPSTTCCRSHANLSLDPIGRCRRAPISVVGAEITTLLVVEIGCLVFLLSRRIRGVVVPPLFMCFGGVVE